MSPHNGSRGYCVKIKYIQLIQAVWAESRAITLYSSIVYKVYLMYRHDFLLIDDYRLDQQYAFGALSSSSILRAHLNTHSSFIYAEHLIKV